jgi:hypothetical protein
MSYKPSLAHPSIDKPLPPLPAKNSGHSTLDQPSAPPNTTSPVKSKNLFTVARDKMRGTPKTNVDDIPPVQALTFEALSALSAGFGPKRRDENRQECESWQTWPQTESGINPAYTHVPSKPRKTATRKTKRPSHDSTDSSTNSGGFKHALGVQAGQLFRSNHASSQMVFSDKAPRGMMEACDECGEEPRRGALYHGLCRECR